MRQPIQPVNRKEANKLTTLSCGLLDDLITINYLDMTDHIENVLKPYLEQFEKEEKKVDNDPSI